jgi:NitT/TauT family transport system permease protein
MEKLKTVIYPLITACVILAAWNFTIKWFSITPYMLPSPQSVGHALWAGISEGSFLPHIEATLKATLIGYVTGCAIAIVVGAALAEWKALDRFLNPFIVALQSMPKVALAPLIIVWCGYGIESKIVIVALICFFPVFVSAFNGIRAANQDLIDLYRGFSASRMSILMNVKLPSAAGPIFSGLQIAVVMALIGAVVGEFIAAKAGLGYLIQASSSTLDVATMFAAIVILSAIGVVGSELLRYLHHRIVFWESGRHTAIEHAEK